MHLVSLTAGAASRLPSPFGQGPVVALCYHRVARTRPGDPWAVTRGTFDRQLDLIAANRAPVVTAGEIPALAGPGVAITFDDNLAAHVRVALPALLDAGVRATFFVNPGELGAPGGLHHADVWELVSRGMAVGAHNDRHRAPATQPLDEFARDVDRCRAFLECLEMPLTWAYPDDRPGSFGPEHEWVLMDRGFSVRFTTLGERIRPDRLDRPQGRYVIRRDTTDARLRSALRGGLGIVRIFQQARSLLPARAS
jgi:peptidoglycan/xylan/chitin deacetylase (PgdA/CDA1 family)